MKAIEGFMAFKCTCGHEAWSLLDYCKCPRCGSIIECQKPIIKPGQISTVGNQPKNCASIIISMKQKVS